MLVPAGTVLATYLSQGQLYQRWWHRASTLISRINHHCLCLFTAGRVDIGNLDRWRGSDLTPPTGFCNHCESSCAFYARLEDCANIACSLDACTRAITRFDLLWLSICEECPAHAWNNIVLSFCWILLSISWYYTGSMICSIYRIPLILCLFRLMIQSLVTFSVTQLYKVAHSYVDGRPRWTH